MTAGFESFVRARTGALLRLAYVVCGDGHLAEDLVQEALMRLHPRFADVADPEAYVRRTIVNRYVSWRRVLRNTERPAEDTAFAAMGVPDASGGVAERDAMWAVLAVLPPRQRAVLALRYYDGLADDDIAALLGCGVGAVRSYASRGLATLRTHPSLQAFLTLDGAR